MNTAVFDILSLLFEFKIATGGHVARFLVQKDRDTHIYFKLRRMWRSGLLESTKVYAGSYSGMPVYYLLSKQGLQALEKEGIYAPELIRRHPSPRTLLSPNLFHHEASIVELASMEASNSCARFGIACKGELRSGSSEQLSGKTIEVFTPDYVVLYTMEGQKCLIYTEFERTAKSQEATMRKLDRYVRHLEPEERARSILRIIFQTEGMEQSFWLAVLNNSPGILNQLNIVTTALPLLHSNQQFLQSIYLSKRTINPVTHRRLNSSRSKLFPHL